MTALVVAHDLVRFVPARLDSHAAVSYTHLETSRFMKPYIPSRCRTNPQCRKVRRGLFSGKERKLDGCQVGLLHLRDGFHFQILQFRGPVSYTHLDVYKRQGIYGFIHLDVSGQGIVPVLHPGQRACFVRALESLEYPIQFLCLLLAFLYFIIGKMCRRDRFKYRSNAILRIWKTNLNT